MAPLLLALLCLPWPIYAEDDEGERFASVPLLPLYKQECSACHVAYPPGLLPAQSWRRLMSGLPRHFGTDASLDATSVKQISDWLGKHAAPSAYGAWATPTEDRITRSAWFGRQHNEIPARTWKLPAVKSAANCAACHTRADQGDFNERYVRIPR
ncbi:MAG: cytochrome C [Burkholderiales bacterium]|nr:MAG: cytochrome C [Burkholderiales bacterium]